MSVKLILRSTVVAMATAGVLGFVAACEDDTTSPQPVPVPAGLAVSQLSLTSVRIMWSAAAGANSYVLQRADANNPGVFAGIGGSLTVTTYDNTGLTEGLAYTYRVAAVRGSDTSTFSTSVAFTTGLRAATITDAAPITVNRTLYADTVYTLSGYVKVANGAVLTIQPGTKIVGDTTEVGSSLWILRGARIEANGTAVAPIVFTSARSVGNRKPGDWGGIIIVGNGIINRTGADIRTEGGAVGISENYAGGNNNGDNSGTLRYVRIEFAGYDISGGTSAQELNSLSMYAVGRGTTLEYVQTMAGLDDSFEWWGGAVDGRYLVSYESGDDHFDATEGYLGRNQFLIAYQTQRLTPQTGSGGLASDPRGFEIDGCDPAVTGCTMTTTGTSQPFTNPTFANFTIIGPTVGHATFPLDGNGAHLRRGTAGFWANGIVARWKGTGLSIRDAWSDTLLSQRDSLNVVSVLLAENGANYDTTANFGQAAKFAADGHKVFATTTTVDTLVGLDVTAPTLDWTPKAGSPANTGGATVPAARVAAYFGGTWVNTVYLGAADPAGTKWWQGWTAYNIN